MVTSRENRFPRALLIAVGLVLAVVAGLWAKEETEPVAEGEEWENAVETPIEIASTTVAQKQDSLYANIDEQFKLVRPIFENACFDCHSTKTDFPWYPRIPGIKHSTNGHVEDGLEHVAMTDASPCKHKDEPM